MVANYERNWNKRRSEKIPYQVNTCGVGAKKREKCQTTEDEIIHDFCITECQTFDCTGQELETRNGKLKVKYQESWVPSNPSILTREEGLAVQLCGDSNVAENR